MDETRDIPTSGPVQYEVAAPTKWTATRRAGQGEARCGNVYARMGPYQQAVCDMAAGHPPDSGHAEHDANGKRIAGWVGDEDLPHALCTAPDCDADHSGMADDPGPMSPAEADRILREAGIDPVAATARMMARCFPDPLRAPGRCVVCGVDRGGPCGQHPTRPDCCVAHGTVAELRAKKERVA